MPLTAPFAFIYVLAEILFGSIQSSTQIALLAAILFAVASVLEILGRTGDLYFPAPLVWALVFVGFTIFQMIWLPGSTVRFLAFIQVVVLASMLVHYCVDDRGFATVEYAFYVALPCTLLYAFTHPTELVDGRVGSTLRNPNAYAMFLLLALMLALRRLSLATLRQGFSLRAVVLPTVVSITALYGIVFLTGSRKGMLTGVGAVCVLALHLVLQQPIRRRLTVAVLVLVLFVGLGAALYSAPQFSRVTDLAGALQGRSVYDSGLLNRTQMLQDAWRLWLERPFTGWGFDRFREVSGWNTYSHNNYVELLANQGLFGLLLFLLIHVSAAIALLQALLRSRDAGVRAEATWALTLLAVLLVWDAGSVNYYGDLTWMALSLAVATSVRVFRRSSEPVFEASHPRSGTEVLPELAGR